MTYLAKLMIVATLAAGPTAALADGYTGTFTGPKGGTATYTGKCSTAGTGVSCTRDSVLTGPKGYVSTRRVERDGSATGVTTRIITTGPAGRTTITTRERLR